MSADKLELTLRRQMHARSAELDGSFGPAPDLAGLLRSGSLAVPAGKPARLRLGLALAGLAVLAAAVASGSFLYVGQAGSGPVSTVMPSASPSLVASSPSADSASPSLPAPSTSPSASLASLSPQPSTFSSGALGARCALSQS